MQKSQHTNQNFNLSYHRDPSPVPFAKNIFQLVYSQTTLFQWTMTWKLVFFIRSKQTESKHEMIIANIKFVYVFV